MDEDAAREAAQQIPDGARAMGLDGPIPDGMTGHHIPGIATELREYPTRYLTPYVRRLVRLYRLKEAGHQLRSLPVLHWPPRFLKAIEAIDSAMARRAHGSGQYEHLNLR